MLLGSRKFTYAIRSVIAMLGVCIIATYAFAEKPRAQHTEARQAVSHSTAPSRSTASRTASHTATQRTVSPSTVFRSTSSRTALQSKAQKVSRTTKTTHVKSAPAATVTTSSNTVAMIGRLPKPKYVRGIHLTAWAAGSSIYRARIQKIIQNTEINTVVIAVKEYNGEVFVPGIEAVERFHAYTAAMSDIQSYLQELKKQNVYTVARVVVFKDNIVAKKKNAWAVKKKSGGVWHDRKGNMWLDPYQKETWEYNFSIADRCLELGFDEIQFDYIRFPSDGAVKECSYSVAHSSTTAVATINAFLEAAEQRYIVKKQVPVSIDVFGLTTSADDDMGIGQIIEEMAAHVSYVCPMVYPSHYAKDTYGIHDPNSNPYKTVFISLQHARKKLGANAYKLRPYLQDFSLGYHYGAKEVRDQIQASYNNDLPEWILWSPRAMYTENALKPKMAAGQYDKTNVVVSTTTANAVKKEETKTAISTTTKTNDNIE